MINAIAAILVLQGAAPTPGQIISKMLARYASAESIKGAIVMEQSAGGQSGNLTTQVQYKRPNHLFIQQDLSTASKKRWLVVSDGKKFAYDEPDRGDAKRGRLVESMQPIDRITLKPIQFTIKDVYAAATLSLGDRSAPLDIAISRSEDLRALSLMWSGLKVQRNMQFKGETVDIVTGDWREYGDAAVSGTFEMAINPAGDLKAYSVTIPFRMGAGYGDQMIRTTWLVNIDVNATPDMSVFKIR